jgi:hypothetical protein
MVCGASESPSVECRSLYLLKLAGEFTVLGFWEVETGANMEVMLCPKRSCISISHHFSSKFVRVHSRFSGAAPPGRKQKAIGEEQTPFILTPDY